LALYYQFHQTPQLSAIRETIKKFEEIKCLFERQKTYHFYSSSLIVTYEAYLEDNVKSANRNNSHLEAITSPFSLENSVRVVMADFAHVFPANDSLDNNYLYGVNSLIDHLKTLLRSDYVFKDLRKGN
jgi:hypothetical protein